MHIDSRQLKALSDEVDQLHHESMRTIHEDLAEVHLGEAVPGHRASRRRFLAKAAAGGTLLTVGSFVAPVGRFVPAAFAQSASPDVDLASFAAGVELALVQTYRVAVDIGKLDAEVSRVARLFGGHHQAHADALNTIVGEDNAVVEANTAAVNDFTGQVQGAAGQNAVLEVLFSLEEAAASTYLGAVGTVDDATDAGTLATILPVESQHATVWATVLDKPTNQYLIEFLTTDDAVSASTYPVPEKDDEK